MSRYTVIVETRMRAATSATVRNRARVSNCATRTPLLRWGSHYDTIVTTRKCHVARDVVPGPPAVRSGVAQLPRAAGGGGDDGCDELAEATFVEHAESRRGRAAG